MPVVAPTHQRFPACPPPGDGTVSTSANATLVWQHTPCSLHMCGPEASGACPLRSSGRAHGARGLLVVSRLGHAQARSATDATTDCLWSTDRTDAPVVGAGSDEVTQVRGRQLRAGPTTIGSAGRAAVAPLGTVASADVCLDPGRLWWAGADAAGARPGGWTAVSVAPPIAAQHRDHRRRCVAYPDGTASPVVVRRCGLGCAASKGHDPRPTPLHDGHLRRPWSSPGRWTRLSDPDRRGLFPRTLGDPSGAPALWCDACAESCGQRQHRHPARSVRSQHGNRWPRRDAVRPTRRPCSASDGGAE